MQSLLLQPHTRLPPKIIFSSWSDSLQFLTSLPRTVYLKLKRGGTVDPDSGLEDCAHIYQDRDGNKYTAVLGLTDYQKQINKYYILQLLQSDNGNQYWLYRSWGRIGTKIGSNLVKPMALHVAIKLFCDIYEEKTGNSWDARQNFIKIPRKMYPIDVDYEEEEAILRLKLDSEVPSKLSKPVQELIQLIFDVNEMNNVMLELELDTKRMPLGKNSSFYFLFKILFNFLDLGYRVFYRKLVEKNISSIFLLCNCTSLLTSFLMKSLTFY